MNKTIEERLLELEKQLSWLQATYAETNKRLKRLEFKTTLSEPIEVVGSYHKTDGSSTSFTTVGAGIE